MASEQRRIGDFIGESLMVEGYFYHNSLSPCQASRRNEVLSRQPPASAKPSAQQARIQANKEMKGILMLQVSGIAALSGQA
jgi:hypothetical protein